jgi:hypothetical protein
MPVELVAAFESEFYRFYKNDMIYFPLKTNLDFKDNNLVREVVDYIL